MLFDHFQKLPIDLDFDGSAHEISQQDEAVPAVAVDDRSLTSGELVRMHDSSLPPHGHPRVKVDLDVSLAGQLYRSQFGLESSLVAHVHKMSDVRDVDRVVERLAIVRKVREQVVPEQGTLNRTRLAGMDSSNCDDRHVSESAAGFYQVNDMLPALRVNAANGPQSGPLGH